jgi:hypothetical protein
MLSEHPREQALRYAMRAIEPLLECPSDNLRFALRGKVFKQFKGVPYQKCDFESVDYCQFELPKQFTMFRGARPANEALARGNYFCVMGAAQTLGRLVKLPWPTLLSMAIGVPVLNLRRGGVGPDFFLNKKLLRIAHQARFVILQVMSGRSIGCSEYPGGRTVKMDGEKFNRWYVLEKLWNDSPQKALEYVRRWNATYFETYRRIRDSINRPTLLLWFSTRAPGDWEPERLLQKLGWGSFPQLVGAELYDRVAKLFAERLEQVTGSTSEQPLSRVTGKPCPYLGDSGKALHTEFGYYPSSESHAALAQALEPWARSACGMA